MVAKVDGPMVGGYFTFATEAQDDDGLPHTLEHLIFLGSELYPYKGVLDLLANKCLASGTNAWTVVDSTTYTMETAGSEGFLNLLPVYLDHMLYPTLTDSAFTTEVYHVTGAGKDGGVVYSEMQGYSSSARDRTFHTLVQELYPSPSGYRYDTGGSVVNLRNETNNEKVRAYHKKYYRPENLQILVIGQIESDKLLTTVHEYEDRIVEKGERPPYIRPWQTPVPALNRTIRKDIVYPSNEVDNGRVVVAFRGPNIVQNYRGLISLDVLLEYLTFTSVSPLPAAFVDISEPLASSVSTYCLEYREAGCYFQFTGVPLESIEKIEPVLLSTLENLLNSEDSLKLSDIKEVLLKEILRRENKLETSPRSTVSYPVIDFGIYGDTCDNLEERLDKITWYKELLEKPIDFWRDMIKTYVLDAHRVIINVRPSTEEAKRVSTENDERVKQRKEALGEEGLKKKAEELAEAKRINEIPPPPAMLNDMPVPSTDSVVFHTLDAYTNHQDGDTNSTNAMIDPPDFKISDLPFKFQVDDVHSNFVVLAAIMDTSSLSTSQRMYLPVLLDLFFESDVLRNGSVVVHSDVIRGLSRDFLVTRADMSLKLSGSSAFSCGIFCNYAMLVSKMEASKYETGIEWLYDVMYHSKITVPRVKVKTNRLLNSISSHKRSGSSVLSLMNERLLYQSDSNQNQINFLRQQKFLTDLSAKLENESEAQDVIDDLNGIITSLTNIQNITFHMAADVKKIVEMTDISKPWQKFAKNLTSDDVAKKLTLGVVSDNVFRTNSIKTLCDTLKVTEHNSTTDLENDQNIIYLNVTFNDQTNNDTANNTINCKTTAYVKGMSSIESSYLQQSTASINNYLHEDVPALLTAIQYFTQLEGPMWREIRGKGLAYNYRISLIISEGTLTLKLNKAAQLVDAYRETLSLLTGYINGSTTWDPVLLDTAKSSLLYEVISRESTVLSVVQQSLMSYYRGVPHSYNKDLLPLISNLTLPEVQRATRNYFTPLLSPQESTSVVVCPKNDVEQVQSALSGFGHEVEIIGDLENSIFS